MLPVLTHSRRPRRGKHRGRDTLSSRAAQAFQVAQASRATQAFQVAQPQAAQASRAAHSPAADVVLIPNHRTHEDVATSSEAPVNFSNQKTKSRLKSLSFKSRNQTHRK